MVRFEDGSRKQENNKCLNESVLPYQVLPIRRGHLHSRQEEASLDVDVQAHECLEK